jgi:hypothetical protein
MEERSENAVRLENLAMVIGFGRWDFEKMNRLETIKNEKFMVLKGLSWKSSEILSRRNLCVRDMTFCDAFHRTHCVLSNFGGFNAVATVGAWTSWIYLQNQTAQLPIFIKCYRLVAAQYVL